MNRQTVLIAIALFAVLAILAVVLTRQPEEASEATVTETEGEVEAPPIEAVPGEGLTVDLYFPGTAGALVAERRELVANTDLSLQIQSAGGRCGKVLRFIKMHFAGMGTTTRRREKCMGDHVTGTVESITIPVGAGMPDEFRLE